MLQPGRRIGKAIEDVQSHFVGLLVHDLLNNFLLLGPQRLQLVRVAVQFPLEIVRDQTLYKDYPGMKVGFSTDLNRTANNQYSQNGKEEQRRRVDDSRLPCRREKCKEEYN